MFKVYKIMEFVIAVFLLGLAYVDWKTRKVPVFALIGMTVISAITMVFWTQNTIWNTLGGIAIGILFLGISKWSKEAIGYGDSWVILALGIGFGGLKLLQILFVANFLASIVSLILCLGFKHSRTYALPYIPFLTIAYLGGMIL